MYAYLNLDKVVHVAGAPGEVLLGTTGVVSVPAGQLAKIGDLWDGTVFSTPVAAITPVVVSPVYFQLLFTGAERVKARSLRATDPVLDDFWRLLDDPRTTTVNLTSAVVQGAVEYILTVVEAAGVVIDIPIRKAAVLTGVVQ